MKPHFCLFSFSGLFLALALGCMPLVVRAAGPVDSAADRERQLIQVLQSDAPKAQKAITCKRLAIYGSEQAVPVLAPLLADPELASWARIALEAIPGPAADRALRQALGTLEGRLLIGVINSLGVRRDTGAVEPLVPQLKHRDVEIAAAAAEALGHIGGDQAARALQQALQDVPAQQNALRSALALGGVLCAEGFLESGQAAKAVRLYDMIRAAALPKQRVLEATRGAILARQADGLPLLLDQLRSADREHFGIGLRTARELPGAHVSEALAAELGLAEPVRRAPLLLALADRKDPAVKPAVLEIARSGSPDLRIVAVSLLVDLGDAGSVPVLLEAAIADNTALVRAAKLTLTRIEGQPVDDALLARMSEASGSLRQVLIELAGLRRIHAALPLIRQSALQPSDPNVRRAAVEALGALGQEEQATELVRMLEQTEVRREQADLERALGNIGSRIGRRAVPILLPVMSNSEGARRMVGVRLLAALGGPVALDAVTAALKDPVEDVQDEAVRALSTWPGNWPQDVAVAGPLLDLARTGKKPAHQILGLRGYLQYLREDTGMTAADKLARVRSVQPLVQRPEERRLAIAVLANVPRAEALNLLLDYLPDAAVAEEACLAVIGLASRDNLEGGSPDLRRKALQSALDTTENNRTRGRAREALKLVP
jgi:HEAT repeat protein